MNEQIKNLAYQKWVEAGSPVSDGIEFWNAAEKELTTTRIRYVAVTGVREIAKGAVLKDLINKIKDLKGDSAWAADVAIWDMGTVENPTMTVVASTCHGWLTIKSPGRFDWSAPFGVSFTPREMQCLKQFFEVWKLDSGQNIREAVENIYEQTYVKSFKPGPDQIKLDRDEFKTFVNKLLSITNHTVKVGKNVPKEKQSD